MKILIAYAYPKRYLYGHLQEPAFIVKLVPETPSLRHGQETSPLILPGLDAEYTNTILTYVQAATGYDPEAHSLLPFPGNQYRFYERVLETHYLFLLKNRIILFPQQVLASAFGALKKEIEAITDFPVFIAPLCCLIICLPVFLGTV